MPRLSFPEQLFTDRLKLQRLRYEDAEEIFFTYASKPQATQYVSWPTHQKIEDTRSFLNAAVPAWDLGTDFSFSVRLRLDNRLIGSFGVLYDNARIQFGYIFSPSSWNRGYATEVCLAMIQVMKRQPGVKRIGTFVDVQNAASVRVLVKSGLTQEGIFQRWMKFPNQDDEPKDCAVFVLAGFMGSENSEMNTVDSTPS